MPEPTVHATAFRGEVLLAAGALSEVAVAARAALAADPAAPILVFDDASGRVIDLDLRGSEAAVAARYAGMPPASPPRGRGRPALGVTAREVTLLPRHWDWLAAQPGGASAALRRLAEAARRADAGATGRRVAREAAYHAMAALVGDRPGFEEAARALFAGDAAGFAAQSAGWPDALRGYLRRLAAPGLTGDVAAVSG